MNAYGRLANQNIFHENSSPTNYSKRNINSASFLRASLQFIDRTILNHIIKCSGTEVYGVLNSDRPKQVFMAETEPRPNFGFHSSFDRNRNRKLKL